MTSARGTTTSSTPTPDDGSRQPSSGNTVTVEPLPHAPPPGTDARALAELPLSEDSEVEAAREPDTLRGCRSNWAEFSNWCTRQHRDPLPDLPDPTTGARVVAVWEGIRRTDQHPRPRPRPSPAPVHDQQHRDQAELVVPPAAAPPRTARSPPCRSGLSTPPSPTAWSCARSAAATGACPLAAPQIVNDLVQTEVARAGLQGAPTRHRSLATLGMYVRVHEAAEDNASTRPGCSPGVPRCGGRRSRHNESRIREDLVGSPGVGCRCAALR